MFDDYSPNNGQASNIGGNANNVPPAGISNQPPADNYNLPSSNPAPVAPAPAGQPKPGLADIFAETEKSESLQPKENQTAQQAYDDIPPELQAGSGGGMQKLFKLLIIIFVIALAAVGGWWGYNYFMAKYKSPAVNQVEVKTEDTTNAQKEIQTDEKTAADENKETPAETQTPVTEEKTATSSQEATSTMLVVDDDQDGLTNEEETALGTDLNNPDSDSDGLFDREEVKVYKTNPLVADTDGDGFKDGDEVKQGYNPNGPGKLYEIK